MQRLLVLLLLLTGCDDASPVEPTPVEPDPAPVGTFVPRPIQLGICEPFGGPGSACADNYDCRRGLACIEARCRLPSAENEPCDGYGDCTMGLRCPQYDVRGAVLEARTCQPQASEGGLCWYQDAAACPAGLACLNGACLPYSAVNGPCWSYADCESSDLFCSRLDGLIGTCAPRKTEGMDCAWGECDRMLTCQDGRCAPRDEPPELEGPCEQRCDADLHCDQFDDQTGASRLAGICRPKAVVGEACQNEEYDGCSRSICVEGVCVTDRSAGEVCSRGACADGLRCVEQ